MISTERSCNEKLFSPKEAGVGYSARAPATLIHFYFLLRTAQSWVLASWAVLKSRSCNFVKLHHAQWNVAHATGERTFSPIVALHENGKLTAILQLHLSDDHWTRTWRAPHVAISWNAQQSIFKNLVTTNRGSSAECSTEDALHTGYYTLQCSWK